MSSNPTARSATAVKITEIFRSIQGESDSAGWPTVFVRLTGCPLRCVWCDTEYAFHGGERVGIDEVVTRVRALETRRVCVTGGEPLAQRSCIELLTRLCDEGFHVSLETSGALPVDRVDPRVVKVVDIKAPGSGEAARNRWQNLDHLQAHDQIKFVLASRDDFDWACEQVRGRRLTRWQVLFSPVWQSLPPADLADWLLASGLEVRMQLQTHKLLWGDTPGR